MLEAAKEIRFTFYSLKDIGIEVKVLILVNNQPINIDDFQSLTMYCLAYGRGMSKQDINSLQKMFPMDSL